MDKVLKVKIQLKPLIIKMLINLILIIKVIIILVNKQTAYVV